MEHLLEWEDFNINERSSKNKHADKKPLPKDEAEVGMIIYGRSGNEEIVEIGQNGYIAQNFTAVTNNPIQAYNNKGLWVCAVKRDDYDKAFNRINADKEEEGRSF